MHLYNKWAEGLKETAVMVHLLREPIAPTTAAAGASAGTNVATAGRTRSATGKMRLTAGRSFLLKKPFCWGALELKSILLIWRVGIGVKDGVIINMHIIIIREQGTAFRPSAWREMFGGGVRGAMLVT